MWADPTVVSSTFVVYTCTKCGSFQIRKRKNNFVLGVNTYLSRSFSTMFNMLLSWQNNSTRCWETTGSEDTSLPTPIPQSNSNCLETKQTRHVRLCLRSLASVFNCNINLVRTLEFGQQWRNCGHSRKLPKELAPEFPVCLQPEKWSKDIFAQRSTSIRQNLNLTKKLTLTLTLKKLSLG